METAAGAAIVNDNTFEHCSVISNQAHVYCLMFLCSALGWFQDKTIKTRIKHSQRNKQSKIIHGNIPSWFCYKCGNQCPSSTPIYKAVQLRHLPKPIPWQSSLILSYSECDGHITIKAKRRHLYFKLTFYGKTAQSITDTVHSVTPRAVSYTHLTLPTKA